MGFIMSVRLSVIALAMLAIVGCAPTYYGQPAVQPGAVAHQGGYGSSGGYAYGGGFGSGYDYDDGPIFRPSRYLTCDRTRNICYDRFGFDYYATARYFGERDANRAVKKYGEQVFLFSPKRGVTCDRRSRSCSDAGGLDVDLTEDYFGNKAEHRVDDWLESATFKPEPNVTCVTATKVCSDKKGPSITLTQVYFGRAAAQDLADELGPGAPGYMRTPEPASNAAEQAPRAKRAGRHR
jgi:Fels-1 Prophage Protein-like